MGGSSPTALVHGRRGAVCRIELRAQQLVEHAGQRVRLGIKSANTQASACAGGGTTALMRLWVARALLSSAQSSPPPAESSG